MKDSGPDSRAEAGGSSHDQVAALIPYFELGTLSAAERAAVEEHALECDLCFGELARGAAVFELVRERRREAAAWLGAPAAAGRASWFRGLLAPRSFLMPRFAVPALSLIVLIAAAGIFHERSAHRIARLASFPREDVAIETLRAPAPGNAVTELLQTGAEYYQLGKLEEAARCFEAALERSPDDVQASYWLGLTRAQRGDFEGAIAPLEKAMALGGDEISARASWVLANVHLAREKPNEARPLLEKLAGGEEPDAGRARELLSKLPSSNPR